MMTDVTTDKPRRPRTLTQIIAMRCEPQLHEAIFLEAVREKRTMSGWVRMVVLDRLAADGEAQK